MNAHLTRLEPHAVTEAHIGIELRAIEGNEVAVGYLSDVLQCWNASNAASRGDVVVWQALTGCALGNTLPHTHLFLGGRVVVLSHARGQVFAAPPLGPCDGSPLPEGAPS